MISSLFPLPLPFWRGAVEVSDLRSAPDSGAARADTAQPLRGQRTTLVQRNIPLKLSLLLWLGSVLPQPQADQVCLATTVYLESRDQPVRGQQAVAEVVLRRVERGSWGNNVCAVVTQRKQFAPAYTSPNFRVRNQAAWDRAWKVAADTREEWQRPFRERSMVVPGADHFYAFNLVRPSWSGGHEVAKIGGHSFLRLAN